MQLQRLTLKGFKTIRKMVDFQPRPLTVLIGQNGAGKTNFISFFRMLAWMLGEPGNLQDHVAKLGGAGALLHEGQDKTREIEAEITLTTDEGENQYAFRLAYAAGDTLIFTEERYRFSQRGSSTPAPWKGLGAGHRESKLIEKAGETKTAKTILALLRKMVVYQFHNTSSTSRMRGKWSLEDNRWLKEDAANIAPFLLRLRENEAPSYRRIVETIRLILPFFADFELDRDNGHLLLKWRERNSDRVFDASLAGDGMLRVIALVTLLLQPENDLPNVLILDEPELGLHPYAINVIGGLIQGVSKKRQVVVATQSTTLVDCFEPSEIVVVNRKDRESEFNRLDDRKLAEWLEEYSLSELWEKNVIGGRPS